MTNLDVQELWNAETADHADPQFAATPESEDRYWRETYRRGLWYNKHYLYEDFAPAYRTGYLHRMRNENQTWDDAERELRVEWEDEKGLSRLQWNDVLPAVQAAWRHVSESASTVAQG